MKQQDIARVPRATEVRQGTTDDRKRSFGRHSAGGRIDRSSDFVRRLSHHIDVDDGILDLLATFEGRETTAARGENVRGFDDPTGTLFVVMSGWLVSHIDLPDGRRQIVSIHLPGDLVGLAELPIVQKTTTLQAVEQVRLVSVPKVSFRSVMQRAPRLMAVFLSIALREQAATGNLLLAFGRMNARERIAYLLLDLHARLGIPADVPSDTIRMPLTQFHIADHLGMTNVYASRMIIQMEKDGAFVRRGNAIELLRRAEMAEEVDFHNRYAQLDTSWYPSG